MAVFNTTTTIRIKVHDQDFDSVLLVVTGETTLKQVHEELRAQLGHDPAAKQKYYSPVTKRKTCLRGIDSLTDQAIHFMMSWTVQQAMDFGATSFELAYTDLCR